MLGLFATLGFDHKAQATLLTRTSRNFTASCWLILDIGEFDFAIYLFIRLVGNLCRLRLGNMHRAPPTTAPTAAAAVSFAMAIRTDMKDLSQLRRRMGPDVLVTPVPFSGCCQ